jgi:hypothetical protein
MPMCIYAVGVYTYGIYGGSYRVNYVVYVWTGRICWGVGVRYIYLISVFLNVYGGLYIYFNTITHMVTYSVSQLLDICDSGSQLTLDCGLRFLVSLYGRLEEWCN